VAPHLVLHVGAPKTGSTYLQRRLRADPVRLRAHGIYVPVLPVVARMAGNAKLLATALSGEPSRSFTRAFPDIGTLDPREIMTSLLVDWRVDSETIVLSAENLRPRHAMDLRELLPREIECTVVLCVRRQDHWVESYYNQMVKTDEFHAGLASFVALLCDRGDGQFLRPDWSAHYEAWHETFGNCQVVIYEEARTDLFSCFMTAAGLTVPPGLAEIDAVQVSLDAHQLAYLLQLARPITDADFARRRAASAEASRRLGAPKARSLLTDADRSRLRDGFDASNRRLAEALGRSHDRTLLQMTAPDHDPWRLEDVWASDAYVAHRKLADAIYSRPRRRTAGLVRRLRSHLRSITDS
jgi:hypothetical protein